MKAKYLTFMMQSTGSSKISNPHCMSDQQNLAVFGFLTIEQSKFFFSNSLVARNIFVIYVLFLKFNFN